MLTIPGPVHTNADREWWRDGGPQRQAEEKDQGTQLLSLPRAPLRLWSRDTVLNRIVLPIASIMGHVPPDLLTEAPPGLKEQHLNYLVSQLRTSQPL